MVKASGDLFGSLLLLDQIDLCALKLYAISI